jgi:hypothetical protein
VKALTNVWDAASSAKPAELQRMREGQKPIRHLQFAEYKVGEYAMIANVPKSQNIGWVDAKFRKLNLKLQPRYSGPYLIRRKLSPVIYVLQVDGFDVNVHATNMKPFVGRKTATTPYAEPGFDHYQLVGRADPEPLVLSPDSTLNEKARVRFRKKNNSRLKDYNEELNARKSQTQRENEMKERLSASQDSLVIHDDLETDIEQRPTSVISQSSSTRDTIAESNEEHANMTDTTKPNSVTSTPLWEKEFNRRAKLGLSSWKSNQGTKRVRFHENKYGTDTPYGPTLNHKHSNSTLKSVKTSIGRRSQEYIFDSPNVGTVFIPLSKRTMNNGHYHPRKKIMSLSLYDQSRRGQGKTSTAPVEECNLAGGEKWEYNTRGTSLDLYHEDFDTDESSEQLSNSSEDSFDREQWHRTVLKACTKHASMLNLSAYEPIVFGFDNSLPHKLRVELDAMLPIPIEMRKVWYQLHLEIRNFGKTGLLFPTMNLSLDPTDHWRNNSKKHLRHVPLSIYLRILSIPVSIMRTLFHPRCQGKITMSTDPDNIQDSPICEPQVIHHKYDQWYWEAMRAARRMDMHPSSPRRAYSKLRGHISKEGKAKTGPEWRAHHFYMWDSIKRNQTLREPPEWFTKTTLNC